MITREKIKDTILAASCFVGPLYLITGAAEMIAAPGWSSAFGILGWLFVAGIAWVLLELWRSELPTDDKLYWTVLGLLFMPIVLPYFWYSHLSGLKRKKAQPDAQHNAGGRPTSDDSPASATPSSPAPRG